MRRAAAISIACVLAIVGLALAQNTPQVYMPLVLNPPTNTPVPPTPTTQPTVTTQPTATIGPTATPTQLPPSFNGCQDDPNDVFAPEYPVTIFDIDKVGEVVTLKNTSTSPVNLTGWTMCSITGNQTHTGIGGTLAPGEIKGFVYTGVGNIWNNTTQDDGALYSPGGNLVSYWFD